MFVHLSCVWQWHNRINTTRIRCVFCTRREPNEWTCELCAFMSLVCNRRTHTHKSTVDSVSPPVDEMSAHSAHIVIYTHRHKTQMSTIKDYKLNANPMPIRTQIIIIVIKSNAYLLGPPECDWVSCRGARCTNSIPIICGDGPLKLPGDSNYVKLWPEWIIWTSLASAASSGRNDKKKREHDMAHHVFVENSLNSQFKQYNSLV